MLSCKELGIYIKHNFFFQLILNIFLQWLLEKKEIIKNYDFMLENNKEKSHFAFGFYFIHRFSQWLIIFQFCVFVAITIIISLFWFAVFINTNSKFEFYKPSDRGTFYCNGKQILCCFYYLIPIIWAQVCSDKTIKILFGIRNFTSTII